MVYVSSFQLSVGERFWKTSSVTVCILMFRRLDQTGLSNTIPFLLHLPKHVAILPYFSERLVLPLSALGTLVTMYNSVVKQLP